MERVYNCTHRKMEYVCSGVVSPSSVSALLPPLLPLRLDAVEQQGQTLSLTVSSVETAKACPVCRQLSTSVHSRYERCLLDLPVQGLVLQFRVGVRRFYCRVQELSRAG